eukprot:g3678.t1
MAAPSGALAALSGEERALASLLHRTTGAHVLDIKQAQQELAKLEESEPRFGILLLQLLHKLQTPSPTHQTPTPPAAPDPQTAAVSLAGGIFFKNYVKRKWPLYQNGVPEEQRKLIKENLVALLMCASSAVQKQLCAAMELIAECDFPFDTEARAVVLEALEPVFRVFEEQYRSNEVLRAVKHCVDTFSADHLKCFQASCEVLGGGSLQLGGSSSSTASAAAGQTGGASSLQQPYNEQQLRTELRGLVSAASIFYSLNVVDLPEQYEDAMQFWFSGFFHFLRTSNYPPALLRSPGDMERCNRLRAQICENLGLYVTKYQEEVKQYVKPATAAVWELLLELNQSDANDNVVASGIKFLSSAAAQNWGAESPFADPGALQQICEKIVLPNMAMRDSDVDLFEDSPLDFIQRDIEEADQDTRRKTAVDLVKALMRFQEGNVTAILMQHVRQLLAKSAESQNTRQGFLAKESCIYLVMAMAVKGGTKQAGCTVVNPQVPFQQYFEQEVRPVLQAAFIPQTNSAAEEQDFPPLRAAGLKYLTTFRSLLTTEAVSSVLADIARHVSHPSAVVHTYAAHALEKLLTVRDLTQILAQHQQQQQPTNILGQQAAMILTGANGQLPPLKFNAQQLQPLLTSVLEPMITTLTNKQGIEQNEYLMRCIVRVFMFLRTLAAELAVPMLGKCVELMEQIACNPKHPQFAHFLFEGVAVVIKVAQSSEVVASEVEGAGSRRNSKLQAVEDKLLNVCGVILQGEVMRDFLPYVFQILGLLLDSAVEVKPVYTSLFQTLMFPEFWTKYPNIPALVRFLKAYLARQDHFQSLLQQNISEVLKRFESTLNSRKTEGMAFDLLGALFAHLPLHMYQGQLDTVFKVALTALMSRKSEIRLKKHFVLAMSIFVYGFRRKRGCVDSLMLFNRLREDLSHYRFESALRIVVVLVDLRKAFPSLDWRLVVGVVRSMGLEKTKLWQVLNASHRSAKHGFGGELFDLRHGCKEGCPGSPLIFIMTFAVVMQKYANEMEARCRARGAPWGGISLRADDGAWHLPREDKIFGLVRCGHDAKINLMDLLFADDTTLVDPVEAGELERILQSDREAKSRDEPFGDIDTTAIFTGVITACGLRENVSKRVQGDVVSVTTRNLGVSTDPDEDVRLKVHRAWRAYWTLRNRISGLEGITNERRGELVVIMIRSILMYGLQARSVTQREMRILHREENRTLGQALAVKWWERRAYGLHYADLRRRARMPPFEVHLRYLQARFFGHVMRGPRDSVTRVALIGKFFPNGVDDYEPAVDLYRSEANVRQLEPRQRQMRDMLGDMITHLRDGCGMPAQLMHLLFETPEEAEQRRPDLGPQRLYAMNKCAFHALARKWFIAETARDWARGCPETRQWAADKLVEKYFGDKKSRLLTRDQIRREAMRRGDDPEQMVAEHYRPPRNGAERMLLGSECPWCCKVIRADDGGDQGEVWCEPVQPLLMSREMRAHLEEDHPVNQLPAEARHELGELVKRAKEKDKIRGEEIRCEVVDELVATGLVSEVRHCGPRRPGRVTHVRKLRRHVCDISFTTGAGAMKLHMQGHGRNDYTKIGQLCIVCRVCGDKVFPYDEGLHNLRARSSKVSKMRKHEEECRRRKEAAEAEAEKKRKKQEEASAAAAKKRKIDRDRKQKS